MSSRNARDTLATSMPFASHLTTTMLSGSSFGLLAGVPLDVRERDNWSVACDMVWLRRAPNCKPCSPHCCGNVRRVLITLIFFFEKKIEAVRRSLGASLPSTSVRARSDLHVTCSCEYDASPKHIPIDLTLSCQRSCRKDCAIVLLGLGLQRRVAPILPSRRRADAM